MNKIKISHYFLKKLARLLLAISHTERRTSRSDISILIRQNWCFSAQSDFFYLINFVLKGWIRQNFVLPFLFFSSALDFFPKLVILCQIYRNFSSIAYLATFIFQANRKGVPPSRMTVVYSPSSRGELLSAQKWCLTQFWLIWTPCWLKVIRCQQSKKPKSEPISPTDSNGNTSWGRYPLAPNKKHQLPVCILDYCCFSRFCNP